MSVLATILATVISIRTTENDVHWGQAAVTTVIIIGFPLMPQKQGAVNQQGQ